LQSHALAISLLEHYHPVAVYCSPYYRARQSIAPFVEMAKADLLIDDRLMEREFCRSLKWDQTEGPVALKQSFLDISFRYGGDGESNGEALARARSFLEFICVKHAASFPSHSRNVIVVVSHGNLLECLLSLVEQRQVCYDSMARLTNPDIYLADIGGGVRPVRRMWDAGTLSIKPVIRRSARALLYDQSGASIYLMCVDLKLAGGGDGLLWITPGGSVDPGESIREALERELSEELGLLSCSFRTLGVLWQTKFVTTFRNVPSLFHDFFFVLQLKENSDRLNISTNCPVEARYIKEGRWFSVLDLEKKLVETGIEYRPLALAKLCDASSYNELIDLKDDAEIERNAVFV
jgi:2,3-bisphosphoglycerate-dependent phosphoglycerate mutase